MIVYAESSAVLSWLLTEKPGNAVLEVLGSAEAVVTSELTLVECERTLNRARVIEGMSEELKDGLLELLERTASRWNLVAIGGEVLDRARRPFPIEPVRTLDAVHLASMLMMRDAVSRLAMLSLDQRVRANAARLGVATLPALPSDRRH